MPTSNKLNQRQREELISTLKSRFEENPGRHEGIAWEQVAARLEANPNKLLSLNEMEATGGQPDVLEKDQDTGEMIFVDFSEQSPEGRRSLCYDEQALESRKKNKPRGSAAALAQSIGIEILTEEQYRQLQQVAELDTKTSSWVKTSAEVRELGGALFCDRRYDQVFLYHNGAESYYAARGFRGLLRV